MPRYPVGQSIRLPATVRDATGALSAASASSLTLHRTGADGSVVPVGSYSGATSDGVGLYHWDLVLADVATVAHYQWVSDFTVGGFHAIDSDEFDVYDPFEVKILSLSDAKDTLDIPQATTKYDDQIARKIATIEASLERFTGGPIVNRTVTERVSLTSGYTTFVLRKRPVVSITSITNVASGATISTSDLDIDTNSGVIRRKLGWVFIGPYFQSLPAFTVVYVAGQGTVAPQSFSEAAGFILQRLWESQRGQSSVPQYGGEDMVTLPGLGYPVPVDLAAVLAPYALEVFV